MKKSVWMIVCLGLCVSQAGAQAVDKELFQDKPASVSQSNSALSIYPFYICLGVGGAPIGSGFNSDGNPWLDNGTATFANGFGSSFSMGPGFEIIFGLDLDEHWSIALNSDAFLFFTQVPNINTLETNFIPTLRYTFRQSTITPYVTAGVGLNVNTDYFPTNIATYNYDISASTDNYFVYSNVERAFNAVGSVGGGLSFVSPFDLGSNVYVQVQYDEVVTSQGSFSYFPLTVGYLFQGAR